MHNILYHTQGLFWRRSKFEISAWWLCWSSRASHIQPSSHLTLLPRLSLNSTHKCSRIYSEPGNQLITPVTLPTPHFCPRNHLSMAEKSCLLSNFSCSLPIWSTTASYNTHGFIGCVSRSSPWPS